jgi:FOG: Transposase and inactivated derivatives
MGTIPTHTVFRQCFHWLNVHYHDLFRDRYAKKLNTGNTILLFLEATMNGRRSVEEIATNLRSKKWLQQAVQLESIDPSSLNRKLQAVPLDVLKVIYAALIQQIASHYAHKSGVGNLGKLRAIDSTEISLPKVHGEWAYVSKSQNAVKMHASLLIAADHHVCADRIVLSTAEIADLNTEVVSALVGDLMETLVMDRGYINYAHFLAWVKAGQPFVARLRANNKCRILHKRKIEADSPIRLDADVEMVDSNSGEAFNVRLVEYEAVDSRTKKRIRIRVITTRFDLTAKEISEIYRCRWKVELFFKWLKQHVKLEKLYSFKPAAVWNQIYLSLIAHALCELIRLTEQPKGSCWRLLRYLNAYAGETVEDLMTALERAPSRNSRGRRKKRKRGRPRKHPKKLKQAQIIIK